MCIIRNTAPVTHQSPSHKTIPALGSSNLVYVETDTDSPPIANRSAHSLARDVSPSSDAGVPVVASDHDCPLFSFQQKNRGSVQPGRNKCQIARCRLRGKPGLRKRALIELGSIEAHSTGPPGRILSLTLVHEICHAYGWQFPVSSEVLISRVSSAVHRV